jgi:hypothetical protein
MNTPRFGIGTIVRHRDFGRGRIVAYDDDRHVILFPGGEAKLVAFTFQGLEAGGGPGDPELDRIVQAVRQVLGQPDDVQRAVREPGELVRRSEGARRQVIRGARGIA